MVHGGTVCTQPAHRYWKPQGRGKASLNDFCAPFSWFMFIIDPISRQTVETGACRLIFYFFRVRSWRAVASRSRENSAGVMEQLSDSVEDSFAWCFAASHGGLCDGVESALE